MQTKNIFKTLALAMLMPTMLLTTACSSEDDVVNSNLANLETVANKGYALPVTVNVTREGDATMRAAFDGSKLNFGEGDKLFVKGNDYSEGGTGFFAGTLTWQSGGTFSGTILTEKEYTGTIDALFAKGSALATLLPANYGNYPYLSFDDEGTCSASVNYDVTKTFATSKAIAVEQFSFEVGSYTSGTGFALHPANAILNFTITCLATNTVVAVAFSDNTDLTISGNVTTNVSGTATFAIAVSGSTDLNEFSLTVGGKSIPLVSSSKVLAAGKIYNINRDVATDLSTINANYTAPNGETLTGTLASNVKISIANGATVTLNNVTINGTNDSNYKWAGITCLGDATIILSGTNTVKGFYNEYPGIYVPEGKKLNILEFMCLRARNSPSRAAAHLPPAATAMVPASVDAGVYPAATSRFRTASSLLQAAMAVLASAAATVPPAAPSPSAAVPSRLLAAIAVPASAAATLLPPAAPSPSAAEPSRLLAVNMVPASAAVSNPPAAPSTLPAQ